MKKSLLVAALVAVALSACGKKEESQDVSEAAASMPTVMVEASETASAPAEVNVEVVASAPVEGSEAK